MTYPIPRPDVYSNPPKGLGRFTKGTWITSLNGRCAAKGEKVHVYKWENGAITYEALNAAQDGYLTVEFSRNDIQSIGDVYKWLGHETTYTCKECGREEEPSQYTTGEHLKRLAECFHCNLWLDKIRRQGEGGKQSVIVDQDWNCYGIGKEPGEQELNAEHRSFLDYGGRLFRFRSMIDGWWGEKGELFQSHNVWFGGVVPERFRDRLPQTHVLVPNPPPVRMVNPNIVDGGNRGFKGD
jgi:hypothetical protein